MLRTPLIDYGRIPAPTLVGARIMAAASGLTYLVWWALVKLIMPSAFNPLGSRLAVVGFCLGALAASFVSARARAWLPLAVQAGFWLITLHYFYLFHFNGADVDWVVGCYITVIAICACLHSHRAFRAYALWVLALAAGISALDSGLARTVFLPGLLTILVFGYFGLRARVQLTEQSQDDALWFQNLFDAVFEGIVVHEQGRVVAANDALSTLFGYRRGEMIGVPIEAFLVPESRATVAERIRTLSDDPYEAIGLRRDGTTFPIEIRAKTHTVQNRVLRLATVSDISARKRIESDRVLYQASQRAIQMRDEFLSIASHELKTPLTTIKLHTQIAIRGLKAGDPEALAPDRMTKLIAQIDRQADRLTRLVEEVLDVARISSDRLWIDREDFDLVVLVREIAESFDASLRAVDSSLKIDAPAALPMRADRFRLGQVFANLLSNAVKYGGGKPVRVRVEESPGQARIRFEDQGIGIQDSHQKRVFERFERAISSKKISGLGLGLYITKHIVEAHGGAIELESHLDRGSCFTVTLPNRAEDLPA